MMVAPSLLFENSGWDAGWKSRGGGQTCQASTVLQVLLSWLLPLSISYIYSEEPQCPSSIMSP